MSGQVGRVGDYIVLRLRDDGPFHRVCSAIHVTRRERVTLHLYDLADDADVDAESRARTEFEAHEWLCRHGWAPQIVDRLLATPDTSGPRRLFFTVAEVSAPSVEARASDSGWSQPSRLRFLGTLIDAINEFRGEDAPGDGLAVSENITAQTVLVGARNTPILSGLGIAQGADTGAVSPSPDQIAWELWDGYLRPEASPGGPKIANEKALLSAIKRARKSWSGRSDAQPPSWHWAEGQETDVNGNRHRVISSLARGDATAELKVVRLDEGEERGFRVGKICFSGAVGKVVEKAHGLVKQRLSAHPSLQAVEEVIDGWEDGRFSTMLSWTDGCAMDLLIGGEPSPVDDQRRPHREQRALAWLRHVCEGLRAMHDNGLVHGNVLPANMIVNGDRAVLSGFDSVTVADSLAPQSDPRYSVTPKPGRLAQPADDVFSLATSLFHVVFGRLPTQQGNSPGRDPWLDWEGLDRDSHPHLAKFLDQATHSESGLRFASASAALEWLDSVPSEERSEPRKNESVDRLWKLLRSYPGGRYGNDEAHGADSEFARQTRVALGPEKGLVDAVRRREVRLLVVSGDLGDGKTSMLQHIAEELGVEDWETSSAHIRERTLPDGLTVRMNLDVSAEGQDRLPDEVLGEFLDPFRHGEPEGDVACFLAINEGRLRQWVAENGESPLAETLRELMDSRLTRKGCVELVMLSRRSLVGNVSKERGRIETRFLERLTDKLYGGDDAPGIWRPCQRCTAQDRCEVFRAAQWFGPPSLPGTVEEDARRLARARLFEAIQAAQIRGKSHATIRDVRSALIYVLFGLHSCEDYHDHDRLTDDILPYHDRAFSPDAPSRQGGLLATLLSLDPALDAHPRIDRYLREGDDEGGISRESARRRAYFEWSDSRIGELAGDPAGLCLENGDHMRVFTELPLMSAEETEAVCHRLCKGISRLGTLPPVAIGREHGKVLLPYPAWHPTETVFWAEKPLERFSLRVKETGWTEGIDWIHRAAILSYRCQPEDVELRVDSGLFCRLMDLSEGYQLRDVASDEAFASLSVFVQRLVGEGEQTVFAWNPTDEETVHQVSVVLGRTGGVADSSIRIRRTAAGAWP